MAKKDKSKEKVLPMPKKGDNRKKVLVVNNGTMYMNELESLVKKHAGEDGKVDRVHIKDVQDPKKVNIADYDAIILSGSSKASYKDPNLKYVLDNAKGTVVGVCRGHQGIAHYYGGTIESLGEYQKGMKEIRTTEGKTKIYKNHKLAVTDAGSSLDVLADSNVKDASGKDKIIAEIIKHKTKPHYGIQGHPEKSGYAQKMLYALLNEVYGRKEYKKAA
jgi:GMP synthase-like glutamine amidotransferase